jgi:hypothetical protein
MRWSMRANRMATPERDLHSASPTADPCAGTSQPNVGTMSTADRVIRACQRLADHYADLYLAEQLAPTQQARQSGPSATGHAPARLDVLDLTREDGAGR